MAGCVPSPTATLFETEVESITRGTTTLFATQSSLSEETGSFPSTICVATGPGGNCLLRSITIITYTITSTLFTTQPTATLTLVDTQTRIEPAQTLFAPCTTAPPPPPPPEPTPTPTSSETTFETWSQSHTTLPNGSVSVTSIFVTVPPGGQTGIADPENNKSSPNVGAIVGGSLGGLVAVSVVLFIILRLYRSNRAMKKELEEHDRREQEMSGVNFTPTPFTYAAPPYASTAPEDHPIPTHPYGSLSSRSPSAPPTIPLPIASIYASTSIGDHGDDDDDQYHMTRTHSRRPSSAGSHHTPSTPYFNSPYPNTNVAGPSSSRPPLSTVNSGEPVPTLDNRRLSQAAIAKAREARLERRQSGGGDGTRRSLVVRNVADDELEIRPAAAPSAWVPPPAYSQQ